MPLNADALKEIEEFDRPFNEWMAKVNTIIIKRIGLCADDLPDYCYADDFADGGTPKGAASRAIKAAKEDF
jgi:hypothetical protein